MINGMVKEYYITRMEMWNMKEILRMVNGKVKLWMYFVLFVILASLIVMNIVVGMVVNSVLATSKDQQEEKTKDTCVTQDKLVLVYLLNQLHVMEMW